MVCKNKLRQTPTPLKVCPNLLLPLLVVSSYRSWLNQENKLRNPSIDLTGI